MSNNSLYHKSSDELSRMLALVPKHVNSINLNSNHFGANSNKKLYNVLTAMPAHISTIKLAGNGLGFRTGTQLKDALSGLPKQLSSVDLSDNGLFYLEKPRVSSFDKYFFPALIISVASVFSLFIAGIYVSIYSSIFAGPLLKML